MKRKTVVIVLSAAAAVGLILWLVLRGGPENGARLVFTPVTLESISNSVTATGTVEPVTVVTVGTQVSGIVDRLYADYNDVVHKGQLIAEMDKINLQAELDAAQAELAASRTEYEYELKNYSRSKALHEKELVSDSEYETATYTYEKAKSAYERSQASMVKVRRNLEYAVITSPIDGVVISRAVEEGQTVAAGFETPTLFTIANDLTKMQVVADVDEADIGQVADGQHVAFAVDAYPNDVFEGTVTQVRLEATEESNVITYEVVISADNPDLKLKPGLTANVTIYTIEINDVTALPSKAFRFIPDVEALDKIGIRVKDAEMEAPVGSRIVWTLNGDTLEPISVKIGHSAAGMVQITDGLKVGDQVVTDLESIAKKDKQGSDRSPFMPTPPGSKKK